MSFYTGVGHFVARSGTGLQTVTGVTDGQSGLTFTPKVLVFWFNRNETVGLLGRGTWAIGFDDGVTHVGAQVNYWELFSAEELAAASGDAYSIVCARKTLGADDRVFAYVSAIRSGEFDVTFVLNEVMGGGYGEGWLVNYVALGGSDLLYKIGQYQLPVSTSPKIVTGLGFRPTALLEFQQQIQGVNPGESSIGCWALPNVGFAAGPSLQMGMAGYGQDIANPNTITNRYQRTNRYGLMIENATTVREFDLTSLDADGFTVTRTAATGSVMYRAYLAVGGVNATVVTSTQPGTLSTETVTTTGVSPRVAFFASANHAASTAIQASMAASFGASDGTRQRSTFVGMLNGVNPNTFSGYWDQANVLTYVTPTIHPEFGNPTGATWDAQGAVSAFGVSSIDLDWTTVDATAREAIVLVLGGSPAAPGAIVVTKHVSSSVVDPVTDTFFFTASGLTPTSFNLTDGASRTFSDVPISAGGGASPIYLIHETDNPRYRVTSVVVSNGSDPGIGLSVAPGETVYVDWYNEDRAVPVAIRRLRRFRLVNKESVRMFCQSLEFDFQPGLGTTGALAASGIAAGSDPTVMLTISRDGGQTWGDEILLSIGALGEYLTRCYVSMLGSYRNGVAEVTVTDPVLGWYLANVYGEFEEGTR